MINIKMKQDEQEQFTALQTFKDSSMIVCCMCYEGFGSNLAELLSCYECQLRVHKQCYEKYPGNQLKNRKIFFCQRCQFVKENNMSLSEIRCEFCPNIFGILKMFFYKDCPTQYLWTHILCAKVIPELRIESKTKSKDKYPLEIVVKCDQRLSQRSQKMCNICKSDCGFALQCEWENINNLNLNCQNTFHITCAIKQRLLIYYKQLDTVIQKTQNLPRKYCKFHILQVVSQYDRESHLMGIQESCVQYHQIEDIVSYFRTQKKKIFSQKESIKKESNTSSQPSIQPNDTILSQKNKSKFKTTLQKESKRKEIDIPRQSQPEKRMIVQAEKKNEEPQITTRSTSKSKRVQENVMLKSKQRIDKNDQKIAIGRSKKKQEKILLACQKQKEERKQLQERRQQKKDKSKRQSRVQSQETIYQQNKKLQKSRREEKSTQRQNRLAKRQRIRQHFQKMQEIEENQQQQQFIKDQSEQRQDLIKQWFQKINQEQERKKRLQKQKQQQEQRLQKEREIQRQMEQRQLIIERQRQQQRQRQRQRQRQQQRQRQRQKQRQRQRKRKQQQQMQQRRRQQLELEKRREQLQRQKAKKMEEENRVKQQRQQKQMQQIQRFQRMNYESHMKIQKRFNQEKSDRSSENDFLSNVLEEKYKILSANLNPVKQEDISYQQSFAMQMVLNRHQNIQPENQETKNIENFNSNSIKNDSFRSFTKVTTQQDLLQEKLAQKPNQHLANNESSLNIVQNNESSIKIKSSSSKNKKIKKENNIVDLNPVLNGSQVNFQKQIQFPIINGFRAQYVTTLFNIYSQKQGYDYIYDKPLSTTVQFEEIVDFEFLQKIKNRNYY